MKLTNAALTIFLLVTGIFAQETAVTGSPESPAAVNITSTLAGGLWSSPATWVGGAVPQGNDNVTIASGATVIIDTAAVAGSVTVGSTESLAEMKFAAALGGSPGVLRFGETAAFSLTVAQDVTIGSNDNFSTGSGSETSHILTVGGNLTNKGTLDFSTNNNLAGAGIVFNGNANNTFGGTGAITDIRRTITINKGTAAPNILELAVSNFTVQGAATDGPASAYLILNTGVFKVSGIFTGAHRTFSGAAAYVIPAGAGFWLNNPNYTVAAQNDTAAIVGFLRVSAGQYNVGIQAGNSLLIATGGGVHIEGGSINIAGRFGVNTDTQSVAYIHGGGTLTTCRIGHSSTTLACFDLGRNGGITMPDGDIIIQNHTPGTRDYRVEPSTSFDLFTGTTVHFGNALTNGTSAFNSVGWLPNVVLDTSAGTHTLTLLPEQAAVRISYNVNIGAGGTLDIGNGSFYMRGDSIVNNGTIKADHPQSLFLFGRGPGSNPVYSGSGVWSGIATRIDAWCTSLTLDPAANNIRIRYIHVQRGNVINAYKLTFGNNDNVASTIAFGVIFSAAPTGTFDSAPIFELGSGGQVLRYDGTSLGPTRDMGPELNPTRTLVALLYNHGGPLTITGGDLTITDQLHVGGPIFTGGSKLILNGTLSRTFGYIAGPFRRRINQTGTWDFPVGTSGISGSGVTVAVSALGTNPSYLTITSVAGTMPGLLPSTSIARYWNLIEEGDITATMTFQYLVEDIRGTEPNYKLWTNAGGPLAVVPGHILNTVDHYSRTPAGITDFTGNWGVGEQSETAPVSIGGSVTQSGGQPIANALVTVSGGNLPAPIQTQTGSFGLYQFSNLQAGETYTVRVDVKRYRFSVNTQQVTPLGNVSNVNFVANPQ
jgi:hypothetical protein